MEDMLRSTELCRISRASKHMVGKSYLAILQLVQYLDHTKIIMAHIKVSAPISRERSDLHISVRQSILAAQNLLHSGAIHKLPNPLCFCGCNWLASFVGWYTDFHKIYVSARITAFPYT